MPVHLTGVSRGFNSVMCGKMLGTMMVHSKYPEMAAIVITPIFQTLQALYQETTSWSPSSSGQPLKNAETRSCGKSSSVCKTSTGPRLGGPPSFSQQCGTVPI